MPDKVRAGLSAGRVQSVATRLVVERERERMAFVPAGYWGVEAEFSASAESAESAAFAGLPASSEDARAGVFTARLATLDGRRVATGRDFTDAGALRPAALKAGTVHLHEVGARAVADAVGRGRPHSLDRKSVV